MDFATAAKLGNYLSRDYAEDLFELLVNYRDISASEAASRLNLHISTAQEFLEAMASLGILEKKEVFEKKRPYFRYALKQTKIALEIDLDRVIKKPPEGRPAQKIKERPNSGGRFATARNNQCISSVTVWIGDGRDRKERKINLTNSQGRFLFHLPFPSAMPATITEIMKKADVEESFLPEIIDIVDLLEKFGVIETQ